MKPAFGSLYACALLVAPALADDAREAVQQGGFLPFTQSPANVSLVRSFGDYDSARRSTVVENGVQARLSEKFQAQADLTYESGSIQPALVLQLSLLDEDTQAIDLQLGGGWTHSGFNQVDAGFLALSSGATVRGTYVASMARFELGQDAERAGILGAAAIHEVRRHVFAGVDSKLGVDLERDANEPAHENSWDLEAGPLATYTTGKVQLTASAGLAAQRERTASASDVGVYGGAGLGGVF